MRDPADRAERATSMAAAAIARRRPWSPWIWAWIVGSTFAVYVAASLAVPQHDTWFESCTVCASTRRGAQDLWAWGLVTLDRAEEVGASRLVTDGLVGEGHVHDWGNITRSSTSLLRSSIACGGRNCGEFAERYEFDPEFRLAVRERLAAGSLTLRMTRTELVHGWTRNDDPDRAEIGRLLEAFVRPPQRIR